VDLVRQPRVLYVEDEPSIAQPFSQALQREGFIPTIAGTAQEALALAEELQPDLILLDLGLPDADGRDVCRELRRRSDVPIIMVTARDSEADRVLGLEIGADDYVVKPFSGREVASRIRAVLRRTGVREDSEPAAPSGPLRIDSLEVDVAARRAFLRGTELELTRKEFDLLVALARRAGHVVTREDLMAEVWDTNWFGSTKTLDVHIGWLRRKLGDAPSAAHWIHTVRGVGFRFSAPDDVAP
jgi:DNA-binding response OmpR family regulator